MNNNIRRMATFVLGIVVLGMVLALPSFVAAGIYNADNEVTYKEYWISHSQFTGSCLADGTPEKPQGNSFYIEPTTLAKCPKTLAFELPDDFSSASKIEIYIDYWRNYESPPSSRFKFNDSSTVFAPNVGADWSRTPYVAEIPKSELKTGNNKITFYGTRPYHVHDVAFRIYYDDQNPLVPGPGSDVTAPDGKLESIEDDNGVKDPKAGGSLAVNSNKLKLTASVTGDVKFVEFHAWYEGYDEDNDGEFRDWHNLGRNNWFPGGTDVQNPDLGGVINHIGTVKPSGGTASVTWDLANITNQAAIRFKIRVVDASGNVRDAAGGDSAEFRMVRNKAVLAFIIPDFKDAGLHMEGSRPDSVQYDFDLPASVADFNTATLLGNYWRSPQFNLNYSGNQPANPGDWWMLGVKSFNKNSLKVGRNRIIYSWNGGPGNFVEYPGPMFVLGRSSTGGDTQPPAVSNQNPAPGAPGVDNEVPLKLNVADNIFGVDFKTVQLKINGADVSNKIRLDGVSSNYLLSYKPVGDWPYSSTINVTLNACDLAGNCMNEVNYSFTTQDPDTTPPAISNVMVDARPNGADISWTTNEPATSKVEYGKTNSYELGMVEDAVLKTDHLLKIKDLQPATLYHFRITSVDNKGNSGQTNDDTFTTDIYPDVSSDDFNTCQLDPKWEYIDPTGDTTLFLNGQQAVITLPAGVKHDWSTGRPPRLMQLANNTDFTIDVKFDSFVASPIQMQGILVEESTDTYMYVGFENLTDSVTGLPVVSMYARFIKDGVAVKGLRKNLDAITTAPMYARLSRTGDKWEWFYSTNGTDWTRPVTPYTFSLSVLKAGIYAGNTPESGGAVPGFTAMFDYFFNAASPIVPEDGNKLTLTLNTNGTGSATKTPDKTEYICGEEVAISGLPGTGWSFESWTGDVESTEQVETVVMDAPKLITANFTPTPYLLNVNIVNNGVGGEGNVVTKNPDQPTYIYGDVVQLTAVPLPGWTFKGWTGGVTGLELTKSVTIQQDIVTTATFEQDKYTFDLQVVSDGIGEGGTATATPVKDTYLYGDVIALKATPKIGWTFTGWTGALTSSEPEVDFTITGNSQVVANFVQDQYDLDVTIVSDGEGEGGTVSLDPAKTSYVYGEVVALIAEPNPGWTFDGWGGALSGNNPVGVLTITKDTAVTATFTQDRYEINVTIKGSGNVKVEPDKTSYLYGDVVKLTAVPAPNLFFGGWSGDLSGAQNPIEVKMTGDLNVTAFFTDNPPPTVNAVPDKTVMINKVVSFTVTASDPENEPLELTVEGLPDGARFTDNGDGTGTFEWTPGVNMRGEYELTFIAADSESIGSTTMTVTVIGYGVATPIIVSP